MLDAAYAVIIIGLTCIFYEAVFLPRLRDDIASKTQQLDRAKRDTALAYARIDFLTAQVARLKPRRDKNGRHSK